MKFSQTPSRVLDRLPDGSHWLRAHPRLSLGVASISVAASMLVADLAIALGASSLGGPLIALPITAVAAVAAYYGTASWRQWLRVLVAVVMFVLLRWPTVTNLRRDVHISQSPSNLR